VTGVAIITATYADATRTATLAVGRLSLQNLSLSSTSTVGGSQVIGTVTLSAPAPAGGLDVTLASSSAVAIVPAHTTIAAGELSQTFTVATMDTASPVDARITATIPFSESSRDATLTIARPGIQQVVLGIGAVPGGLSLSGTVVLVAAPPTDTHVTLSSSNASLASVPATVTIPAGTTSGTFDISTVNAPATRTVTITAAYAGTTQSASLTVIAFANISSLSCTSTQPKAGTSVTCTATLSEPAPAGGRQFVLMTSDDTIAGPAPDRLAVSAGSVTFTFEVVTAPVTTSMTAVVRILDAPSGLVLFSQAFTVTP